MKQVDLSDLLQTNIILFVHKDKKDKTQVLPTYEVFSLILHNNYNKYTYEKEHDINESISVTITHVKQNRKTAKKGGKRVMLGHNDHVGYIYKFIQ